MKRLGIRVSVSGSRAGDNLLGSSRQRRRGYFYSLENIRTRNESYLIEGTIIGSTGGRAEKYWCTPDNRGLKNIFKLRHPEENIQ